MKTLLTILVALATFINLHAQPVQWTLDSGGNGHWYEFVSSQTRWVSARNAALGMTHQGRSGHLVSITSPQENQFVYKLLAERRAPIAWIGVHDVDNDGAWRWIDGPDADTVVLRSGLRSLSNWPAAPYQNWTATSRPSEFTSTGATAMWGVTTRGVPGTWQTFSPDDTVGFVVEYSPSEETANAPAFKADTTVIIRPAMEIEWSSIPGRLYKVQTRSQFGNYPWADRSGTLQSDGLTTKWLDRDVGGQQKLYRIIAVEKP